MFSFVATSVFKDLTSEGSEVQWPQQRHEWHRQASHPGLLTPGPPRPPDPRPSFLPPACTAPSYPADFPFLSCFPLLGYKPSAVFPHVFWSLREILLECPVPSPSEFPALFNCSQEIPALLEGAQEAVKSLPKTMLPTQAQHTSRALFPEIST